MVKAENNIRDWPGKINRTKIRTGIGLLCCLLVMAVQAHADVSTRDMQVVARAISFLESAHSGEVYLGIIFDPANNRSLQQAAELTDMLSGGFQSGSVTLTPISVPITDLNPGEADLYFLTEFTDVKSTDLPERHLPCVTVDLEQVMNGTCVMGIRTVPKVEIVVNRNTAEITGTYFASVFRMMIREID